jgi:hypothetical protein
MSGMRTKKATISAALLALMIAGPAPPARADSLAKIAPYAFLMKLGVQSGKQGDCMMAEMTAEISSREVTPNNAISKHFAGQVIERYRKGCIFWKALEPVVAPVFQRIVQQGGIPPSVYFFTIFDGDEEKYTREEVGLFDSLQTCRTFETDYQSFGLGTGRCREWTDTLRSRMKSHLQKTRSNKPPIGE